MSDIGLSLSRTFGAMGIIDDGVVSSSIKRCDLGTAG